MGFLMINNLGSILIRSCPLSVVFEVLGSNIRSACDIGLVYGAISYELCRVENNR